MTAAMRQRRVAAALTSGTGAARSRSAVGLRRRVRSTYVKLGARPEAIAAARNHARAVLAAWGLAGLAGDAAAVVSELVTNAIQAHQRENLRAPVRLTLLASRQAVLIVVRDAAVGMPEPACPGVADVNGRGLLIVDALSACWDTRTCPGGGKAVRALLLEPRPAARARDGT